MRPGIPLHVKFRSIVGLVAVIVLLGTLLLGYTKTENSRKWQGTSSFKHQKEELKDLSKNRMQYSASGNMDYSGYVSILGSPENGSISLHPETFSTRCDNPTTNIAYIKTHKTGSTTLSHIINRFGIQRNLSFILPQDVRGGRNYYLNITDEYYSKNLLPPLHASVSEWNDSYKYNLSTLHVHYDRIITDQLIEMQAKYITTLRDPATQFESAFAHFKFEQAFTSRLKDELASKPIADSIAEWLQKPEHYLMKLKAIAKQSSSKGRPLHLYSRNGQMNDLGFEDKHHGDPNKVSEYIASLDKDFDLVLITEYFDESLLILKKQFCWEVEDILYISENQRSNLAKTSVPQSLRDSVRKWNSADFQLYQHFNRTLWKKVQDYGPEFIEDLSNFRKRLKEIYRNCTNGQKITGDMFFRRTVNVANKNNPCNLCNLLVMTKDALVNKIRKKQSAVHTV